MDVFQNGSRVRRQGPADWFTGSVVIESLFDARQPARASSALVTFQPGARTAWHKHPLGQILIITQGTGWVQIWGGPVTEINTADVVWFAPDEKHWHGATATTTLSHIAIHEALDGKTVDWLEHVSEDQYRA